MGAVSTTTAQWRRAATAPHAVSPAARGAGGPARWSRCARAFLWWPAAVIARSRGVFDHAQPSKPQPTSAPRVVRERQLARHERGDGAHLAWARISCRQIHRGDERSRRGRIIDILAGREALGIHADGVARRAVEAVRERHGGAAPGYAQPGGIGRPAQDRDALTPAAVPRRSSSALGTTCAVCAASMHALRYAAAARAMTSFRRAGRRGRRRCRTSAGEGGREGGGRTVDETLSARSAPLSSAPVPAAGSPLPTPIQMTIRGAACLAGDLRRRAGRAARAALELADRDRPSSTRGSHAAELDAPSPPRRPPPWPKCRRRCPGGTGVLAMFSMIGAGTSALRSMLRRLRVDQRDILRRRDVTAPAGRLAKW